MYIKAFCNLNELDNVSFGKVLFFFSQQACHICGQLVKDLQIHIKIQHTEKDKLRKFINIEITFVVYKLMQIGFQILFLTIPNYF